MKKKTKKKKRKWAKTSNVRERMVDKMYALLWYLPYFTDIITFDPHTI